MSPHRAVIEAGPGAIRRLCCGADVVADTAVSAAALAAIDDQVALLDERPVAVDSLWFDALRSVAVDHRDGPVVVHPSWWSAARVEVVTAAARGPPVVGATVSQCTHRPVRVSGSDRVAYQTSRRPAAPRHRGKAADRVSSSTAAPPAG